MYYNIFLHFFNRDSRQIYGLYHNATSESHISLILEALNVSVFLCSQYCLLPPVFFAECELSQEALQRRSEFLEHRIIRIPLREQSWDAYWQKKENEYAPFKDHYSGLFKQTTRDFFTKYPQSLIHRSSHIGPQIVLAWENAPDMAGIWTPAIKCFNAKEIDCIRKIPSSIMNEGLAITWPAIVARLSNSLGIDKQQFRSFLQHHYFHLYVEEYDLRIITNLPFSTNDFGLQTGDLRYDYEALREALFAVDLWFIFKYMSASSLILVRSRAGYFDFREIFDHISKRYDSIYDIKRIFAIAYRNSKSALKMTKILNKYNFETIVPPTSGILYSREEIDLIDTRLSTVSASVLDVLDSLGGGKSPSNTCQAKTFAIHQTGELKVKEQDEHKKASRQIIVAVFVALEMERTFLVKRWNLKGQYPDPWEGNLGSTRIVVIGPNEMGRVPAAIVTMGFLAKVKPDLIIVTGIAGGFESEDVELGDVIVATSIADLAIRKIREGEKGIKAEFRPKEFRTDKRIFDYLNSGSFDMRQWEESVVDREDWPRGRRPKIMYGTLASTDEVVSSDEWIQELYDSWPKLLGVEMEAGGVCAAAEAFDQRVAVLRGVSDRANPAKADNEWRKISMKTVANLIENIDFSLICNCGK